MNTRQFLVCDMRGQYTIIDASDESAAIKDAVAQGLAADSAFCVVVPKEGKA